MANRVSAEFPSNGTGTQFLEELVHGYIRGMCRELANSQTRGDIPDRGNSASKIRRLALRIE